MNNILLRCQDLIKTYREGELETPVLRGINLAVMQKEMLAIVGSSGSGKSTMLHLLGALDTPTSGTVLFEQQDIYQWNSQQQAQFRNRELGFVYQFHHLLGEFTALENVAMPLLIGGMAVMTALRNQKEEDRLNKEVWPKQVHRYNQLRYCEHCHILFDAQGRSADGSEMGFSQMMAYLD